MQASRHILPIVPDDSLHRSFSSWSVSVRVCDHRVLPQIFPCWVALVEYDDQRFGAVEGQMFGQCIASWPTAIALNLPLHMQPRQRARRTEHGTFVVTFGAYGRGRVLHTCIHLTIVASDVNDERSSWSALLCERIVPDPSFDVRSMYVMPLSCAQSHATIALMSGGRLGTGL